MPQSARMNQPPHAVGRPGRSPARWPLLVAVLACLGGCGATQ
jgi:hypothetical protein